METTEELNYGDDAGVVSETNLSELAAVAEKQEELELEVKGLTLKLSQATARLKDVAERELPELMENLGLKTFETKNGLKIDVDKKLFASIAKGDLAKQEKALQWLEDHGHDRLIKREFKIKFGKDEEKWANKFQGDLAKRKRPVHAEINKSVHSGTLSAFLADQIEQGVDVPMEIFSAIFKNTSKIYRT
jgi:hypothetical protein